MKRLTFLAALPATIFRLFSPGSGTQPKHRYGAVPARNLTTGVLTLRDYPLDGTVRVYANGVRNMEGIDYSISGRTVVPKGLFVMLYAYMNTVIVVDYDY